MTSITMEFPDLLVELAWTMSDAFVVDFEDREMNLG